MVTNRIIFFATSVQPNPEEIDYWVDLSDNPYGGSIKYFNGTEWVRLAASGGTPDLSNYYTKTQVNKLLNDKANISDVDSKVDDEEVKDVIKDIQFNTSNPNDITMVMFKYDGSNKTVSIPVASTSSAGIITSKDFLDFVKQHQLQELHTEMIDTFADIRAKYQKKLIAGLNIEIDQETNVISASGNLAVRWDNIINKPDFKPVATSGDYNDLINKLKPGKDVSISEDNVISIAIDSDSLEQSLATLQSNIDKEAATARAAETKLGNDIATEKNRAKGAESANATAIANEVERATGVEETLNSNITQLQTQKVDKVEGKGLSTNDYTTPEKNKLAAIEAEANKYVLPAATASALGGVKIGSNITLANGGTISITKTNITSALGVDPTTTYVKKAGDTMTGTLTSASTTGSIVFKGVENSDITNIYKSGGNLSEGFGMHSNADITNGLRFNWYDTFWYIGNIRGSGTESYGFGIVDNNDQIGFRVTTDAVYANKYTSSVSTGNAPISVKSTTMCPNLNADMVDGYGVSNFNTDSVSIKRSINSVNQSGAENWIKLCTLPLTSQMTIQDKRVVFEIVGGTDVGEKYAYYATLTASTKVTENVELRILNSVDTISIAMFIAGYVITSDKVEIWIRTSNQWGANTNIVCKYASTNAEDILSSPATTQRPSNFVLGNIKTLDAPDWYGVSWSETSSNPDCTRIGNMDMHRSLPIQSMMKGYIHFKSGNPLHRMLKLNDNWTKCESYSAGGWRDIDALLEDNNVNVMIKIPEFWWINDYVESTETHNLKICPHAKPGWHHHKEAYVSAYEGYIDGNYYRSYKNKIPSVGFTRSAIRPKARANGLGNSWNIYTYNEHRAICHLFLVEYATRNSQKAVNTELTPEGFRQGGLGSGCTTGTATINGAQTWSFIPTGSSDSLGSGSGEVTVTIQQTDSSGSNTSTITRKCNRYRGIENPFGHIWKHTDDVISVYISGFNTRFWYKCDSPDHFGDSVSENPYYKNIAANGVATGYKSKIVTTSTCDFFALSCTNGSETTYWCDYNWDNTNASEHCLLIGGDSGDGGAAGLFSLRSSDGVGLSYATIGSRLTYLPWAE